MVLDMLDRELMIGDYVIYPHGKFSDKYGPLGIGIIKDIGKISELGSISLEEKVSESPQTINFIKNRCEYCVIVKRYKAHDRGKYKDYFPIVGRKLCKISKEEMFLYELGKKG